MYNKETWAQEGLSLLSGSTRLIGKKCQEGETGNMDFYFSTFIPTQVLTSVSLNSLPSSTLGISILP